MKMLKIACLLPTLLLAACSCPPDEDAAPNPLTMPAVY